MWLIGSKGLKFINNCHDEDCLEIIDSEEDIYYYKNIDNKEVYHISSGQLKKRLNYSLNYSKWYRLLLWNYQLDKDIIGKDFPYEFHLLEHKEEVIKLLEFIKENKLNNYSKDILMNGYVDKIVYHIAITKFFLLNNCMKLTRGQKAIIQKIHDRKMTWEEYEEKVGY